MENKLSLFDYLGKPAGKELGRLVYRYYCLRRLTTAAVRNVQTKTYTGEVMIYPKEFLDEFFAIKKLVEDYHSNIVSEKFDVLNSLLNEDFEKMIDSLPF